jgi:hypothetical protein
MNRLRQVRLSPAMVVAIVALVAALVGTAAAGVATTSRLDRKEKKQIRKIARKLANQQITRRAPTLSVAAAGTATSADSALTTAQLGNVTVQRETGSIPNGEGGSVDAFCPAGTKAIGGGGRADDFSEPKLIASRPTRAGGEPPSDGEAFTGWRVSAYNDTGDPIQPEAWVVCVG